MFSIKQMFTRSIATAHITDWFIIISQTEEVNFTKTWKNEVIEMEKKMEKIMLHMILKEMDPWMIIIKIYIFCIF